MSDEDLVTELIDVVVKRKELEKREAELKMQVVSFIFEHGKFENDLAFVSPVEHQERTQFDRKMLAKNLESKFGLTGLQLEGFLEQCSKQIDIMPGVTVRLKKPKDD